MCMCIHTGRFDNYPYAPVQNITAFHLHDKVLRDAINKHWKGIKYKI